MVRCPFGLRLCIGFYGLAVTLLTLVFLSLLREPLDLLREFLDPWRHV